MPFEKHKSLATKKTPAPARSRKAKMHKLMLDHIDFDHAPIYMIPGIHGHDAELEALAEALLILSGGTQKIYIYRDPHFDAPNRLPFETVGAHAAVIAKKIKTKHEKSNSYIPPIVLGFSFGCLLASYVVDKLYNPEGPITRDNPRILARLVTVDGGAHNLLRTYYQSPSIESINEILLILNTAAELSGLKKLEQLDSKLSRQLKTMLTPSQISQLIIEQILDLNPKATDYSRSEFARYCTVINQNLDAITEAYPTKLSLPFVHALFTHETLFKLNARKMPEEMSIHGGFENYICPGGKIFDTLITDESTPLREKSHLALIKDKETVPLVAKTISESLKKDLDSPQMKADRALSWQKETAITYTYLHSSSSEEDLELDSPLGSPPTQSASPSWSPEQPRKNAASSNYSTPQQNSPMSSGEERFVEARDGDTRLKNSPSTSNEEKGSPPTGSSSSEKINDDIFKLFGKPAQKTSSPTTTPSTRIGKYY